jgi:hypothetical protein
VEGMMKAKYEKMIDAWVKKHYGDLERGVLSDEVKYKVLFKIYRKKYKKEKILAETFSRMLTRKDDTHNWSAEFDHLVKEYKNLTPQHDDVVLPLCDTCKYQNKNGEFCEQDLVQNKESDCYEYVHKSDPEARPDCVHCKHSKMSTLSDYMGAATSILYCEKKKYKCDLLDPQMCEYFEEKKNE